MLIAKIKDIIIWTAWTDFYLFKLVYFLSQLKKIKCIDNLSRSLDKVLQSVIQKQVKAKI